uniref:G-protein coupled receptors family 3 profile domain-containing protein n=1 Tax=Cricetulus griseus TaxID=10029 RepID=A0A8C2LLW1_CRIGR
MVSRKKCLVLGLTAFLWVELHAQNENQNTKCRLLGKFNLTGYVEALTKALLSRFNFRGFRWMKTMIHTIKEINERKDILPNHTLGYQIFDNCYTISKTMETAFTFLTGQEEYQPNFRNSTGKYLVGIIGAGGSLLSVAASRILELYHMPQVGYTSSCPILSDKFQFPSYLRTIPSDKIQSEAMVTLIKHFGWVWVGAIAADDDFGKYGKAVNAVMTPTARVIVLYTSDIDLSSFVLEMVHHNITDRTWIASEAWITSALIAKPEYFPYFGGTIGFAVPRTVIPGLKEFLYDVHPIVYAMAYGLDRLSRCDLRESDKGNMECSHIPDFKPMDVMCYLKGLKFTTHDGRRIQWNMNGDLESGYYDILNRQIDNAGEIAFVKVGEYKFQKSKFELVLPKNSMIFWNTESSMLPDSVCTKLCPPGTRKRIRQGQPICCFDCIPCADGYVSEKPGQRECDACGEDDWSNAQKSKCVSKEVEFLAYEEALGFTLVILSIFGALVVLAVTVVYVIHRHTPLVKANDQELSFLIQMSLVITVLSSMLFIGKPLNWSCMARQVTLALGFCLCLSSILGKTISLFFAYRISKSKTRLISIHPITRKLIVLICVLGEISVCSAYLLLEPPRMYKDIEPQNVKIIFECNEGSIEFLCSIFGFDVLLALLCFLTTFVARQLPDNYYEGKCITFAMLVFFIVWISFVPAYLSTKGKFKVAVEIFAILASSYGLLGCIFLPKCFIILLRPKRNTEETVGGRVPTVDRSIQLTSASVSSELNNTTVSTVLDE